MYTHTFTHLFYHINTEYINNAVFILLVTHCGLVMPYGEIWVDMGLGNGLLPDGTKSLPAPMLTHH